MGNSPLAEWLIYFYSYANYCNDPLLHVHAGMITSLGAQVYEPFWEVQLIDLRNPVICYK